MLVQNFTASFLLHNFSPLASQQPRGLFSSRNSIDQSIFCSQMYKKNPWSNLPQIFHPTSISRRSPLSFSYTYRVLESSIEWWNVLWSKKCLAWFNVEWNTPRSCRYSRGTSHWKRASTTRCVQTEYLDRERIKQTPYFPSNFEWSQNSEKSLRACKHFRFPEFLNLLIKIEFRETSVEQNVRRHRLLRNTSKNNMKKEISKQPRTQ